MPARLTLAGFRAVLAAVLSATILGVLYAVFSLHGLDYLHGKTPTVAAPQGHDSPIAHAEVSLALQRTPRTQYIGNSFSTGNDFCERFPDPGNLVVSIKSGATAIHDRLPVQLSTTLRCVRRPLIFSDLEQNLGDHHVYDVLSRFSPEAATDNAEFDIYLKQEEYVTSGRANEIPKLSGLPIVNEDWRTRGKSAAWGLDKYKFLHEVERAWELEPGKEWYLFIEADTYLSWPSLLQWLPKLNPREKLYLGSPTLMWERSPHMYFANRGPGLLLSGAATREFVEKRSGLAHRWDHRISKMFYGDYVLGEALLTEMHLTVSNASIAMNTEGPTILGFSKDHWCLPVVSVHHMSSQQSDELWQHERQSNSTVLLHKDLYEGAYPFGLPKANRDSWDNAADVEDFALPVARNRINESTDSEGQASTRLIEPHDNHEACELACNQTVDCMMFKFVTTVTMPETERYETEMKCHLSRVFKLGQERRTEAGFKGPGSYKNMLSGWNTDRIARWVDEHEGCPESEGLEWPPYYLKPASETG